MNFNCNLAIARPDTAGNHRTAGVFHNISKSDEKTSIINACLLADLQCEFLIGGNVNNAETGCVTGSGEQHIAVLRCAGKDLPRVEQMLAWTDRDRALELGINFFDTANVYSLGASEEVTGRALKALTRREDVVIATKVWGVMRPGPNGRGLSRKAILHEIDASLKRLGTDYVDLYQIHRWDDGTPIEETMEALHDVVKAGKARYLGASSMFAWQLAKALHVAERNGFTRFVSMQDYVNLLYREEEREMLPLCRAEGIAVLPWSPLARGRLTRDWDAASARSETDEFGKTLYAATADADRRVHARLGEWSGSRVMLNDYLHIDELAMLSKSAKLTHRFEILDSTLAPAGK